MLPIRFLIRVVYYPQQLHISFSYSSVPGGFGDPIRILRAYSFADSHVFFSLSFTVNIESFITPRLNIYNICFIILISRFSHILLLFARKLLVLIFLMNPFPDLCFSIKLIVFHLRRQFLFVPTKQVYID